MTIVTSRILTACRTGALCVAAVSLLGLPSAPPPEPAPRIELTGAASSQTELIERLLAALAAKDLDALHALRATESEWKAMYEWQVPVGAPPRTSPAKVQDLAWGILNTKSLYYERYLMAVYGGRNWQVKAVSFKKGTGEWAGYRVHRQLRLAVVSDDGKETVLATGSIVDIDGRFKFGSFVRD